MVIDAVDIYARAIHHEMDHLNGMMIIDRMVPKSLRHDDVGVPFLLVFFLLIHVTIRQYIDRYGMKLES